VNFLGADRCGSAQFRRVGGIGRRNEMSAGEDF
jgi:hypothetical protein